MSLDRVLNLSGIPSAVDRSSIQISNIVDDIGDCAEHTVVFAIHKNLNTEICQSYVKHDDCYIVTDHPDVLKQSKVPSRVIVTEDAREAYWQFVNRYRRKFDIPVVGVTGTCGKTTTKEMIVHILAKDKVVQATVGSKNANHFNLEYLLGIEGKTDVAVFEMAVGDPDDILQEARYFHPTIGVITNIGMAHLDECHSMDNYIAAKAKMLQALDNKGHLILNGDDENVAKIDLREYHGTVHRFGCGLQCEYCATDIQSASPDEVEFVLHHKGRTERVRVAGIGTHTAYNALAAIATACNLGVPLKTACRRLATYQPLRSHLQVMAGLRGCTIIDDTWGSNPTSMATAIHVLSTFANTRKKILVTGRMHPLGDYYDAATESVARQIVSECVDVLVTKGAFARDIGKAAIRLGVPVEHAFLCSDVREVSEVLQETVDGESVVLFKNWGEDDSFDPIICRWTQS